MNNALLWMALGGGELLLIAFVLLLVYWIRHSSMARRDRKAVARLIAGARKGKAEREATIAHFLKEKMGLSGAAFEQAKVALLREELRLLQRFADTYRRRDSSSAAQFQLDVEAALAPYQDLSGTAATVPEARIDLSELESLRERNERLSEELSVTMDTMSRMLSEYSTMFTIGDSATEPGDVAGVAESAGPAQEGAVDDLPPDASADDTGESPVEEAAAAASASSTEEARADAEEAISSDLVEDLHTDETVVVSEDDILGALGGGTEEVSAGPAVQPGDGIEMRRRPVLEQEELDIAPSEDLEADADIAERIPEGDVEALLAEVEQSAAIEAEDGVEEIVSAEQPVEPDEIDRLLERDPLEEGLDDLFDNDDIAVLDDEVPARTKTPKDDDDAIAI